MEKTKDILVFLQQLLTEKKFEEAKRLLDKTNLHQQHRLAIQGSIAFSEKQIGLAEQYFLSALAIDPKNEIANANYAQLLVNKRRFKEAYERIKVIREKNKTNETFALVEATCLSEMDRYSDACQVLQPFADGLIKPLPSKRALNTYGTLLRAAMRPQDAIRYLETSNKQYPGDIQTEKLIADILCEIDPAEATERFSKLDAEGKLNNSAKWNWSFNELRQLNFELGWKLYDYGLLDEVGKVGRPLPSVAKSIPLVTDLSKISRDKWTFLSCEQGLGDQILFLSCLNTLMDEYGKRFILIAEDRLAPILRRSFESIETLPYSTISLFANYKHRINGVFPIGSLMRHFRKSRNSFLENQNTYLKPDLEKVNKIREILTKQFPNKRIVGISWSGGYWKRQIEAKSIDFLTLARSVNDNEVYVSLQYGDVSEERRITKKMGLNVKFVDGFDFKKDIDSWFALICACDEVLSVSTAAVHFAGAAGIPVKLLLTGHKGPFIWGLDEGRSLPYASVELFRLQTDETYLDMLMRAKHVV